MSRTLVVVCAMVITGGWMGSEARAESITARRLMGTVMMWLSYASKSPEFEIHADDTTVLTGTDTFLRNASTILNDLTSDYLQHGNTLRLKADGVELLLAVNDELAKVRASAWEEADRRRAQRRPYVTVFYTAKQKAEIGELSEAIRVYLRTGYNALRSAEPSVSAVE